MSNRPAIPAEIEREIFIESGHRCAVCGTPFPLERAHIIPFCRSREHRAEDLICLCANCHERADKEEWGEKTLREYKRRPWVMRQNGSLDSMPELASRVKLVIEIELEHFNEMIRRSIPYTIVGLLGIPPDAVRIRDVICLLDEEDQGINE
jgi:type I restriction enzyme R subunit